MILIWMISDAGDTIRFLFIFRRYEQFSGGFILVISYIVHIDYSNSIAGVNLQNIPWYKKHRNSIEIECESHINAVKMVNYLIVTDKRNRRKGATIDMRKRFHNTSLTW